jgi:hypothetical protein
MGKFTTLTLLPTGVYRPQIAEDVSVYHRSMVVQIWNLAHPVYILLLKNKEYRVVWLGPAEAPMILVFSEVVHDTLGLPLRGLAVAAIGDTNTLIQQAKDILC